MRQQPTKQQQQRALTAEEALAYYVDAKLTTSTYKMTRRRSMSVGHYEFPSYYSLRKAKLECIPPENQIIYTETSAEINLQAIVDITVQRLVKVQESVIKLLLPGDFELFCKWGCDGSSGHSNYKQKFQDSDSTDEYLFLISFVPIQLMKLEAGESFIAWKNPRTSSTRYCRPIKFLFRQESSDLTRDECLKMEYQIRNLVPTKVKIDGVELFIRHKFQLTMVDGKVCNALTANTSSQSCYICGATPKLMNSDTSARINKTDYYSFGLSTLHSWIRSFECLLHVGYRLEIKKWQIRGESAKTDFDRRKLDIQKKFKNQMGLNVDKPKPGFGSSNDGNTARRFFKNAELSSTITGVDINLIKRFNVILSAISSGYDINLEKYKKFADETKEMFVSLYPWYYMPVTVHKLLCHGTEIIQSCLVPIGELSEEAQEARNKDCRRFRELHTRKRSRVATNTDLLTMLIITSDPLINSYREPSQKHTGSLSVETLLLLQSASAPITTPHTSTITEITDDHDYIISDSSDIESDSDYD